MKNISRFLLVINIAAFIGSSAANAAQIKSVNTPTLKTDDFMSWNQVCFEEELKPDYVACMKKVHERLGKEIKIALMNNTTEENKAKLSKAVQIADNQLQKKCFAKIMAHGPGSLNIRRMPLCINEGRIALLKRIKENKKSFE